MNKHLIIALFFAAVAIIPLDFPHSAVAVMAGAVVSALFLFTINRLFPDDREFLVSIFAAALLPRLLFGSIVHVFELRDFFGGDAFTYDTLGHRLTEIWFNSSLTEISVNDKALNSGDSGWGMNYFVGFIYTFTGRNIFAAQTICGVIGAASAPMTYLCAKQIFENTRVAKLSALFVALYPAFIIWSGQLLKDGIIVFLLVLSITLVLQLQKKFSYAIISLLIIALLGIIALRFYIFYAVAVAIVGTFVVGSGKTTQSIFKRLAALVLLATGMTYIGVVRDSGKTLDSYDLQRLQNSRKYQATTNSGYGSDLDVSTTGGAISALPLGFLYLMLAPFPWEVSNFRQMATLPEVLVWWCSIPLMIFGLIYTLKHRLRRSIAVLIFSLLLTVAYAIFQGNVGTAYRQRTQIQVFLFMFIAVGWELRREKRRI